MPSLCTVITVGEDGTGLALKVVNFSVIERPPSGQLIEYRTHEPPGESGRFGVRFRGAGHDTINKLVVGVWHSVSEEREDFFMELLKEMTEEQAQTISSPAIRNLVVEHVMLKKRAEAGERMHAVTGYDKFTHSKTSCQCICVLGGMG
jgi:hypothetical protein